MFPAIMSLLVSAISRLIAGFCGPILFFQRLRVEIWNTDSREQETHMHCKTQGHTAPVGAGFSSSASCSVNESADRGFAEDIEMAGGLEGGGEFFLSFSLSNGEVEGKKKKLTFAEWKG